MMIKFERMSNKTRSEQRPPKQVTQVSAAFLAAYRQPRPAPEVKSGEAAEMPTRKPQPASPVQKPSSGWSFNRSPAETSLNGKKTGVPGPSKSRPNLPERIQKGNSITDGSYSALVMPARPQKKNGASAGNSNANPVNGNPADKKIASSQPEQPNKPTGVPEQRPAALTITSMWSRDATPVQIPLDPPARPVDDSGKTNGAQPAPNHSPALPQAAPPRLENAARGTDQVRLGLDRLLKLNDELPSQAAVLGVSGDGLPVLLDLNDPASGAVLVISDERETQMDLLRTAVASMAGRAAPSGLQFLVLSCQAEMWRAWVAERGFDRHCLDILNAGDEDVVRDWVIRMADWTEQRLSGQRNGPPVLLIMDSLAFLPRLPYDVRLNFDWMTKEGPAVCIWPLAAVSTDLATALGTRMLRAFESRILGFADDPVVYMRFAGLDAPDAARFGQPGTFSVRTGDSWLRFHLPRLP